MSRQQRGNSATWQHLAAIVFAAAIQSLVTAQPVVALERQEDFGQNPGELRMYLHRPTAPHDKLPLVVALHGCRQTAADFDDETGLTALAEEIPFLLLLPEQRKRNMTRRCFRWYDTRDNQPGLGESASILAMIDRLIEEEQVDPTRVYALGLSAGGAMTAVLLANYPSRFAGGAIFAGLPYGCNRPAGLFDYTWNWFHYSPFAADGADASYACGIVGFESRDLDGERWADLVTQVVDSLPQRWPLVSLWQGTADETVDPDNLSELVEQWTVVQGIDSEVDEEQTIGNGVTRQIYHDDAGNPRVESWSLEGYGHALPIDSDGAPQTCGRDAPFIVDADLCAVSRVADFWKLRQGPRSP